MGQTTMCWKCSTTYPITGVKCSLCGAINLNVAVVSEVEELMNPTIRELAEYARHDSWRCKYGECKCGLNDLTDKIGLGRIPCE